jgi:hypothetical protein
LGLSIFTKIPIFAMIPLIGYLVYTNSNNKFKNLGIWFIPVVLISMIWPVHAYSIGEFDLWMKMFYIKLKGKVNH